MGENKAITAPPSANSADIFAAQVSRRRDASGGHRQ